MLETFALTGFNLCEVSRKSGIALDEVDNLYMNAKERDKTCVVTIETATHVSYE